ncbi:D-sedoheptulose 7-phosphate isomerase [Candidatus Marinamargulisbacteria bacterium SCGC AG-410-N11]|nr:D-sedoheptulose 7-phosphate isomerase [Candidatus Marinamargulisbacteria bacterium SCGC AG-410-N11]
MNNPILTAYLDAQVVLNEWISNPESIQKTETAALLIKEAIENGNKGLICGNGGSSCDAMHFAEEFTGRYRKNRPALPVISLTDPSHITCVANDFGFDQIFARGVEAYGKENDFFIGLSTSGNSQNVIEALNQASKKKLKTILLLGKGGGKLKGKADLEFIVPGKTPDRIQEIHMMILHIIIEGVERHLYPDHYN